MRTLEDLLESAQTIVGAVRDFNLAINDLGLIHPWNIDNYNEFGKVQQQLALVMSTFVGQAVLNERERQE